MITDLLEREVYRYPEVDQILALPDGTARRWVDGYDRRGRHYDPVIRARSTGEPWVRWGEFVEVRILAEYRSDNIPLQHLRETVHALRVLFGGRYALATYEPYLRAQGRSLALDLAAATQGHDETDVIVATGQRLLSDRGKRVMETATLRTILDRNTVVEVPPDSRFKDIVVNPDRRGGEPTFRGRRLTVVTVAADVAAGESEVDVAASYELSVSQVHAAVLYGADRRAA